MHSKQILKDLYFIESCYKLIIEFTDYHTLKAA